jgi:hypothetical protein
MRLLTTLVAASMALTSFSVAPAKADDEFAAGALGFAVGTLFGTAVSRPRYVAPRPVYVAPAPVYVAPAPVYYGAPAPWTPPWYSYCSAKFRSFDPASGTYLGYDGYRHMCQ